MTSVGGGAVCQLAASGHDGGPLCLTPFANPTTNVADASITSHARACARDGDM
jgi:hypothetical protein